ncbi:S8 family serine peptidase [Streptomyces lasiicapitis]|uniref:Type VII secretion-associated serine protease n=1 Tax=Streptomyces lasiicapitis TaxID=1923961 RepID=A0ABQ2MQL5_9ACTN|nr:S8 family serine peptidase [Streptomyces lasiicapitis]GGO56387.1 type VII secretion-associated serine protease [Streptomyces lasiicapitis]
MVSTSSAVSVLVLASLGLAPSAAADDVQSKQWYLDAMGAEELWDVSTGEGIKVAVVDTGVSETPSLKGRVQAGKDVTDRSGGALDDYQGHGTTMAELIAGSGRGGGLKGLAPGAKVISVRLSLQGANGRSKDESDSAEAIRAAADSDAQIISMSFGSDVMYPAQEEAVKYAASRGKLMFASVGNEAQKKNFIGYPAAYPNVTGVSSADKSGKVAKYSEFGEYVDLAAPGRNLPHWCDATFRSYCDGEGGTSASTAIASASAALIWSKHPNWTANQVLRVLIDTAGRSWPKDKPSDYLGYGLVRPAPNLLKNRGNPGPPDIDPLTNEKTPGVGASPSAPSKDSSAESSAPSPKPPNDAAASQPTASVSSSKSDDDNGQLWIVAGAVAVAVVIGGGAVAAARKRRNA